MLPGLGPINGVAILMPLAFALKLPPETALILLAAVYMGCEYGGRISSILLNVPGDAGAIMTALDGYPMARKGMGGVALSISAWSSFIGSLIATIGIVLFAPLLARWALAFGPAEYFALMCFAFACITGLMGDAAHEGGIGGSDWPVAVHHRTGLELRRVPVHGRQPAFVRRHPVHRGGDRRVLDQRNPADAGATPQATKASSRRPAARCST